MKKGAGLTKLRLRVCEVCKLVKSDIEYMKDRCECRGCDRRNLRRCDVCNEIRFIAECRRMKDTEKSMCCDCIEIRDRDDTIEKKKQKKEGREVQKEERKRIKEENNKDE